MELKRKEIYIYTDVDSAKRDPVRDMDLNLLTQMPIYSVKGNSKQRIGEIIKAFPGSHGIYADIILTGGFKLSVEITEEGVIVPALVAWEHPR